VVTALLAVIATAGLSLHGVFEGRGFIVTAPVALAALVGSTIKARRWTAVLLGFALIAIAVVARTAWVNFDGCTGAAGIYRDLGASSLIGSCSSLGLWGAALGTLTALIAGIWATVERHAVRWWVVGMAVAPVALYVLSVVAFVLGGG
jgi:hypothetical protein